MSAYWRTFVVQALRIKCQMLLRPDMDENSWHVLTAEAIDELKQLAMMKQYFTLSLDTEYLQR